MQGDCHRKQILCRHLFYQPKKIPIKYPVGKNEDWCVKLQPTSIPQICTMILTPLFNVAFLNLSVLFILEQSSLIVRLLRCFPPLVTNYLLFPIKIKFPLSVNIRYILAKEQHHNRMDFPIYAKPLSTINARKFFGKC